MRSKGNDSVKHVIKSREVIADIYIVQSLSVILPSPLTPDLPSAALIRGNRKNCAQFSGSLDWLISRLERLEASSGELATDDTSPPHRHTVCLVDPQGEALALVGKDNNS